MSTPVKPARKARAKPALAQALTLVRPESSSQRARAYQGFTQQILSGNIRPGQLSLIHI